MAQNIRRDSLSEIKSLKAKFEKKKAKFVDTYNISYQKGSAAFRAKVDKQLRDPAKEIVFTQRDKDAAKLYNIRKEFTCLEGNLQRMNVFTADESEVVSQAESYVTKCRILNEKNNSLQNLKNHIETYANRMSE